MHTAAFPHGARKHMLTTHSLVLLALIFFAGGLVKGTVGFGLPTIGIGLGAMVVDIPTAIANKQLKESKGSIKYKAAKGEVGTVKSFKISRKTGVSPLALLVAGGVAWWKKNVLVSLAAGMLTLWVVAALV